MKKRSTNLFSKVKKSICLLTAVSLSVCALQSSELAYAATDKSGVALKDKYSGFEGRDIQWDYGVGEGILSYSKLMSELSGAYKATEANTITITPTHDVFGDKGKLTPVEFEGKTAFYDDAATEKLEFSINVRKTGLYRMEIDYFLDPSSTDHAKRALLIDNEYPFTEAGDLEFYRYFKDEGEPVLNSIGDETRPKQVAINGWRTQGLNDTTGVNDYDFNLYLTEGAHTITLISTKTSMYISEIRLTAPKSYPTYAEKLAEYKTNGYKEVNVEKIVIQAESEAIEKNDTTLRRENDGDPKVYPPSGTSRRLNVLGGSRWKYGNQSITWKFNVPESGLYKLGMYQKQTWNDGLPSYRQVLIDGEIPFEELAEYRFDYTGADWMVEELSDENDDPYLFYLEKGDHTITLTVKMGALAPILESVKEDIEMISDASLAITMIAGSAPDPNYDWKFYEQIPWLESTLHSLSESLGYKYELAKDLGDKVPAMANNFLTIKSDIDAMIKDPFSIARRFEAFNNAQTSLSEWYQSLQYLPLVIDELYVGTPSENWYRKPSNFFQKLGVTIKQFFLSFTKDYDNVGGVLSEDVVVEETIDVWIARSTEYAEILKQLADETFTPNSHIAINVNVLPGSQLNAGNVNAIMLAITADKAPDVALGVDTKSPVEFAIREQVVDLSSFADFEEVKSSFVDAIFTPFKYQGGVYAIPETMNFNVLFYRKDILSKYGIDLPNTWQDMYDYVLPALYNEGYQFYFGRDLSQFLFQLGGEYYTEDGMRSALDSAEAYQAFTEYTDLFTNYSVPKTANFYQYFRSGIMPLGVGGFSEYLTLTAAAPEITGKWGIISLPGHMREDGTIDRTAGGLAQNGDIILAQSEKKDESWEFLKWWASDETQTQFAKEVESLIGSEARWNSANKAAFLSLDWNDNDLAAIQEYWLTAKEIPYVLGGYMTDRHITNAWTSIVMSGMEVREALEQAVKAINRELRMKQEEYGVIADER